MSNSIFQDMAKTLLLKMSAVLITILFLALPAAVIAGEITYAGDGKNLSNSPAWLADDLFISLFPSGPGGSPASGNKITVQYDPTAAGVKNPQLVIGGLSESGNVSGNSVAFKDGKVDGIIFGGRSGDGDAADNVVIVSGGFIGWHVFGGFSCGSAKGNSVTVSGGSVGGNLSGGFSCCGSVAGNSVTVSGGSVVYEVYGGSSTFGDAIGNTVIISGGSIGNDPVRRRVCGGTSESSKGSVSGNHVIVSGGSIANEICGGFGFGSATDNTVTISGGSVANNIYGGYVYSGYDSGSATGNTVTISGRPNLTGGYIRIFGGYIPDSQCDAFSGNTLNLKSFGISVAVVGNFEFYNFDLPEDFAAHSVMLSVAKTVDLAKTTVKISLPDGTKLQKGDKIALIHSAEGVEYSPKNKSCQVKQGGAIYEFSIYADNNNLWAEVTKISSAAK